MNNERTLKVLFFASLKEKVGANAVELEMDGGISVGKLRDVLMEKYPAAADGLRIALAAVDQEFAFDADVVPNGAEVAFFPPVSGGIEVRDWISVTSESLDHDELIAKITFPSTGAVCLFSGIVRGETQRGGAHKTEKLEYEAYIPMAEAKMAQVAREIRDRWQAIEGIVIVQRIGVLHQGTPTVVIACSASHRDTGVFEAARYGIDRLKEIVPIWKKEIDENGEEWVDGNYQVKKGD